MNPAIVVAGHKKPGAPDSPSAIQETKRYLEDFDRLQKTATSDHNLFDQMPALLVEHHRPGFYFRVLQEGEVGANDEIVKTSDGPERISVADVDALLYLPGHSSDQLQRALRIPALSKGWQSSFHAMLEQDLNSKASEGNPGLATEEQAPAWPGFRKMRVARIRKESDEVTSIVLAPTDGKAIPEFPAGQFVVLRLLVDPGKPPVLRSYSLSDLPAADHLRISVKKELNGIGSSFLCSRTQEGDILEVSAPRGSFTLGPSQNPVVLLSAGVGATPVMSMLHALAVEGSQREIWWIYGARNSAEHPFAEESRSLLKQLARGREADFIVSCCCFWATICCRARLALIWLASC